MLKSILIVGALCAVPVVANAQQSAVPNDEQSCKALGGSYQWAVDRCFTGKSCSLENSKQGWEAFKDGQKGCSRFSPEYARLLPDFRDPERLKRWCTAGGGFFSFDRCFVGGSCLYKGKPGSVAIFEGQFGCSEFGPRRKDGPSVRPNRTADQSV